MGFQELSEGPRDPLRALCSLPHTLSATIFSCGALVALHLLAVTAARGRDLGSAITSAGKVAPRVSAAAASILGAAKLVFPPFSACSRQTTNDAQTRGCTGNGFQQNPDSKLLGGCDSLNTRAAEYWIPEPRRTQGAQSTPLPAHLGV